MAAPQNGLSLVSHARLRALLSSMLRCRMVEQRARVLAHPRVKRSIPLGREAVAAGVLLGLHRDDALFPGPGDVAAAFLKGAPLGSLLASLRQPEWPGHAPSRVLPVCTDAASRLALATGHAAASRQNGTGAITVVFCGSAASAPAAWLSSMRFAARHALPILFVCWNPRPTRDLYRAAERCGVPGIAVDGLDAIAVYRVASEAIAHARRGHGPTLIECKAGFSRGLTGGRLHGVGDAIRILESSLAGKGLWGAAQKRDLVEAFARKLRG